jgi:hypothetical protein
MWRESALRGVDTGSGEKEVAMVVEGCAYGWREGVERRFLSLFFFFLFLGDLGRDELLCCAKVPPSWLAGWLGTLACVVARRR